MQLTLPVLSARWTLLVRRAMRMMARVLGLMSMMVLVLYTVLVRGVVLALVSGIVTSGMGYALWYAVLPRLAASVAAVAQLTVPVIAVAGGALFLSEPVPLALVAACALVLGGVALSVLARR